MTQQNQIVRYGSNGRMSQIVTHGGTIYLAGQVADDVTVDAQAQAEQILRKIDKLLAEVGSDKSRILSATCWLADMRHFDQWNAAWDGWVAKDMPPARATLGSAIASPVHLVEVGIIAAL